jgi:hypothetical protein
VKEMILKRGKRINAQAEQSMQELGRDMSFESRMAAIQALIPLGLKAVADELHGVRTLARSTLAIRR